MRLLHIRVHGPTGEIPSIGRSIVRLVGLVVAIVPLFAGFLPVLFTDRDAACRTCLLEPRFSTTRSPITRP